MAELIVYGGFILVLLATIGLIRSRVMEKHHRKIFDKNTVYCLRGALVAGLLMVIIPYALLLYAVMTI